MIYHRPDFLSAVALTGAAACWGVATVMTKAALTSIPPLTLLAIQLIVSNLLLWTLIRIKGHTFPHWRVILSVGVLGLLNPGISYTLSLLGLTTTTASMSTLLWASEPVLILGLAWLVLRESLTPLLVVLSLSAMSGIVLVSGLGMGNLLDGQLSGNLLILSGVLCCALYTVLAQRARLSAEPLVAVTLQQSFALIWALLILPLELRDNGLDIWRIFDTTSWLLAILSGIIYYALAFWFYLQGLAHVRATTAGVFINLIPIFGVGTAYLFLAERLSSIQWVGACMIVVAVFLILWNQHRAASTNVPSTNVHR